MAGGQNNSRQTAMSYPNGRVVDDVYSASTARSAAQPLTDDNSGTVLESYQYLGLDTIVERDHRGPGQPRTSSDRVIRRQQ